MLPPPSMPRQPMPSMHKVRKLPSATHHHASTAHAQHAQGAWNAYCNTPSHLVVGLAVARCDEVGPGVSCGCLVSLLLQQTMRCLASGFCVHRGLRGAASSFNPPLSCALLSGLTATTELLQHSTLTGWPGRRTLEVEQTLCRQRHLSSSYFMTLLTQTHLCSNDVSADLSADGFLCAQQVHGGRWLQGTGCK